MTPEEWAEVIRAAEAAAFRRGAEAMREAVAVMIETWKPINWHGWRADEVPEYLVTNVRALPLPQPPVPWAADEADLPDDGDVVTHRPITLPGHYPDWRRAAEPLALWLALAVGWLVVWGVAR